MAIDRITDLFDAARVVIGPLVEAVHPEVGSQKIPQTTARWPPAVSTSKATLDDPQGWYQHALAADAVVSGVNVLPLAVSSFSPEERRETHMFTRHTLEPSVGRIRPFALPADSYSWAAPSWAMLVKADGHVVTHAGIVYRVIQVGNVRVPVGGICGVLTLDDWHDRGYARAVLAKATAFVGMQLWAQFAVVVCPKEDTAFYQHLGWHGAEAPIQCEQPNGRVSLEGEVALSLPCQDLAAWPSGPIDLLGEPW